MLELEPGEEGSAVDDRLLLIREATWEARYFMVLNSPSENGLSLDTSGRLSEPVTPRATSSCAVHLLVIGVPLSE